MLVDATCTPADIRFPTDLSLLNEAREKTEKIIDVLHEPLIGKEKKVRTYRNRARRDYLRTSKKRRRGKKEMKKAIRKQLGYVKRNLRYIKYLSKKSSLLLLTKRQYRSLLVLSEVYRQQAKMFELGKHKIEGRIVSISQPHIRPIVRGKAGAATEFGAKLTISVVNNFVFTEKLGWEAYNEGSDLPEQIEGYKERFGYYPESVHADQLYRNRTNIKYCKDRSIRLSGPALGRPPKEKKKELIQQMRQDELDRIPVEGKFGNGKRKYGLDRIMSKRKDTSETTIGVIILILNLERLLSIFICHFGSQIQGKRIRTLLCIMVGLEQRKQTDYSGIYPHSVLANLEAA